MLRQYPQTIPAIQPMPEYLATGQRKQWYEEMKADLAVPWVGVVTMAYAHYPYFFETFWRGVKPLVKQNVFVEQRGSLRSFAQAQAHLLGPQSLIEPLRKLGYAERELQEIRAVVEVFSQGNFTYLLLATIVRLLMEGEELGVNTTSSLHAESPNTQTYSQGLVLMEAHHADAATRGVYEDIKTTLGLPFVNTDYRALARWPSYFALAWSNLRSRVRQPRYETCCQAVHVRAVDIVTKTLPNAGALTAQALREAAAKDGKFEEVLQVARLFQWLLPGLVINVALMREELAETHN